MTPEEVPPRPRSTAPVSTTRHSLPSRRLQVIPIPSPNQVNKYLELHNLEAILADAVNDAVTARPHGQSAPLSSAPARHLRLLRAHLSILSGVHSQEETGPLGTQPLPRVLERAASKAADSNAFHHPGPGSGSSELHRRRAEQAQGRQPQGRSSCCW